MIRNLTLKFSTVLWTGTNHDRDLFDESIRAIECGIYVLYLENEDCAPVYDKNKKFRHGGEGKLVIHGKRQSLNGASLKPGKFQGGIINRRSQDANHLHRTRTEQRGTTFPQCLKVAFVLDLSTFPVEVTKKYEKVLKKKVDDFIAAQRLQHPGETRRGDWRHLTAPVDLDVLKKVLMGFLADIEEEIGLRKAA